MKDLGPIILRSARATGHGRRTHLGAMGTRWSEELIFEQLDLLNDEEVESFEKDLPVDGTEARPPVLSLRDVGMSTCTRIELKSEAHNETKTPPANAHRDW